MRVSCASKLPKLILLSASVCYLISCSQSSSTNKIADSNEINRTLPQARIASAVAQQLDLKLTDTNKPNILWIVTDDQRVDSIAAVNKVLRGSEESALGYVESPNLDALAKEGVLFTHAYNQSPGCSPSRYSMVTGQYPHRSGRYGFEYSHKDNDFAQETIPEVLRKHGYQTMLAGKAGLRIRHFDAKETGRGNPLIYDYEVERYALGKAGITDWGKKDVWDWSVGKLVSSAEVFYFPDGSTHEFENIKDGKPVTGVNPIDNELDIVRAHTRRSKNLILAGESPQPAGETLDGHILKAFKRYLKNENTDYESVLGDKIKGPDISKPVMLSLSFAFPHTPVLPPKSYQDRFEKIQYKIPKFSKDEVEKLPAQLKKLYEIMQTDGLSDEEKQRTIQDYYAFTAYGDALIGEAIEDFKAYSNRTNRPYIILMTVGDHGWHLGEQGIQAKFAPWNMSGHGAIIAVDSSGKYFPKNTVHTDFVEYVDIAPTLYAAAGVDTQKLKYLDGFDLANIIRKPKLKRDYVLGEMNQIIGDRAYLRSKRYAFSMRVRPQNGKPGETHAPGDDIMWAINASAQHVEMSLYDMSCDPNERNNIAYDPAYTDVANALRIKAQNIFLGDGRVEIDWTKQNVSYVSDFAKGAHDLKLPDELSTPVSCS